MTKNCKNCGENLAFGRYRDRLLCVNCGKAEHAADQRIKKSWRNTPSHRKRVRLYDQVTHPEKYAERLKKAKDKRKNS